MLPVQAHYQLATLLSIVTPALAALYTDPSQLPQTTYDYIVIGAGTAGNVIADRVSAISSTVSVLVLEAGISNEGVLASEVPLLGPSLAPGTIYDWNYTTTPQTGFNGRAIPYPRGKLLGGSSSINYLVYNHGSDDDWNRYAKVTGDQGWNWHNMQKYIKLNEKITASTDGHNITGQYNPKEAGRNGKVSVSLYNYPTPLDQLVVDTLSESDEFHFNEDMNAGNVLGVGWTQSTIGDGQRSSSATSYLANAIDRPNLSVLINAQVTKLVQTGTKTGLPHFGSVEFASGPGVPVTTVTVNKEIILSAGSIGTPNILLLSGIGPSEALRSVGVTPIVDNPSVGQNMSDHVLLSSAWLVNNNGSFDDLLRTPALLNVSLAEWSANKTGPLADTVTNQLGWFRLPDNSSIFETVPDPSAGSHSSHYEIIWTNFFAVTGETSPATGNYMTLFTNVISPTARGSITLNSSDPFDHPLIDPHFLSTDFDILCMRECLKAAERFIIAKPWDGFIIGPYGDLANANTDDELEAYARNHSGSVWHMTGTASMSPRGASWGVVDPDLKVKGVHGLRIADGSVLPYVPNAHTQGPIYMVGERAAALIAEDW